MAPLNPFVGAAEGFVGRAVDTLTPSNAPPLTRPNYARELLAALFLPFAIAAVEGGVLGVIVRKYFDPLVESGEVSNATLNFAVAVVTAAPAFANITSFLFVRLAHGRHKVRTVNILQVCVALLAITVALSPRTELGLLQAVAAGVAARMCMAGVITIRSAIWRLNYPRHTRARLTGRIGAVTTLVSASVGLTIGWLLNQASTIGPERETLALRIAVPALALVSLIGVFFWARVRVRGHRALLRAERKSNAEDRPRFNPLSLVAVLINDPKYALFMLCQFVIGVGNMMCIAPIVILVEERFALGYRDAMLITQVIPFAMIPLFVGFWSSRLDRWHIIKFRAIHTWVFVAMMAVYFCAAHFAIVSLMFLGAALRGLAFAGGAIAWNLGHNDFATDDNAAQYMAVHVTLTGVRGLVAPFIGVAIYNALEANNPGSGANLFAIAAAIITIGGLGFVAMATRLRDN